MKGVRSRTAHAALASTIALAFLLPTTASAQDLPPPPPSDSYGSDLAPGAETWALAWPPGEYRAAEGYGVGSALAELVYVYWPQTDLTGNVQWDGSAHPYSSAESMWPVYASMALQVFTNVFGVGPTPSDPVMMAIVKDTHAEYLNEQGVFQQHQWAGLFDGGQGDSGMIMIPARMAGELCAPVVIAHELGHYIMHKYNRSNWSSVPDWLIEGGADYLASLAFDEETYPDCYAWRYRKVGKSPEVPLWTERKYDGYPFLRWVHSEGVHVVQLLKDALNGYPPHQLIAQHQLDERWAEYVSEIWGDERYQFESNAYECDKADTPNHEHHGYPDLVEELNPDEFGPIVRNFLAEMEPYTARFQHFRSEYSDLYRVELERIWEYSEGVNEGVKVWASAFNGSGQRQIDLSDKDFGQFVPGSGADSGNDYYHAGNDVALAISCVKAPDEGPCATGGFDESLYIVSITLPDVWQLRQLRLGLEEPYLRAPVRGLVTLYAYKMDEGNVRLVNKARSFWPEFDTKYYSDALDRTPQSGDVQFRNAEALETFVELSCGFSGKQTLEIIGIDAAEWLDNLEDWDEVLEYEFKAGGSPVLIDTPHHFRCVPNPAAGANIATMMVGGMAGAAAQMAELSKWTRLVNATGFGDDSWAGQIETIAMGTIAFGLEPDEEKALTVSYARRDTDNYFLVKVSDGLVLTYREVKR